MSSLLPRFALGLLALINAQTGVVSGQSATRQNLTIEEVVQLVRGGFSEELIITRIRKHGKAFDLSADELVELRKAGVPEIVIRFLLDPSQPYSPPAPPAAPAAAPPPAAAPAKPPPPPRKYPADSLAGRVPPEPGLYYFAGSDPAKVDLKMLLGVKQGPGLGKVLLKKGRTVAYLPGRSARVVIARQAPVLYIRLPEGKNIEEYVLVELDRKDDRRELDTGPGPKQELNAEAIRPCQSLEVGPGLFRLEPAPLKTGEYLLFQVGSADPEKGIQGRGYEFSVVLPASRK